MQLDYNVSGLSLWIDPSEKFVNRDTSNGVISIIERATGQVITQPTASARPTWAPKALNNTPGFVFSGAHYLIADWLAPYFNGTRTGFTCVFACIANTVGAAKGFSMAHTTSASYRGIAPRFDTSGTVKGNNHDHVGNVLDHSGVPTSGGDTSPHIYTLLDNGMTSLVKRDGALISAADKSVHGTSLFNQFTIGADRSSGSVGSFLTGVIGSMIVYQGINTGMELAAEKAMKVSVGL
jgi:uncharacterized membrane protein YeaQ/YmgE (transglycosylase-associated protein family)